MSDDLEVSRYSVCSGLKPSRVTINKFIDTTWRENKMIVGLQINATLSSTLSIYSLVSDRPKH